MQTRIVKHLQYAVCHPMVIRNVNNKIISCSSHTVPSRNSTKAVQTEGEMFCLDFPTPPPAIDDGNEYSKQAPDDYLSLKVKVHLHFTFSTTHISATRSLSFLLFAVSLSRTLTEWTEETQRQSTERRQTGKGRG